MKSNQFWAAAGKALAVAAVTLIVLFAFAPGAGAQTYKVLYTFQGGTDGAFPEFNGSLISDAAGNLYGTNTRRGNPNNWNGQGVVFQLTPGPGGSWTETSPYTFCLEDWNTCSDGAWPDSGLIFDKAGNLYGTAQVGGIGPCYGEINGCGVVFKLTPNPDKSWTYTPLYKFTGGKDGAYPVGSLTLDAAGNLYGTAGSGGARGYGVVFQLTPNGDGSWAEKVIHGFAGHPAKYPSSGLVFDRTGNLYGTVFNGGPVDGGAVYKLTPNSDGSWTYQVIHVFAGQPAMHPTSSLVFDLAGNLYGMATAGGPQDAGVIFKLTPAPSGKWTSSILHIFRGPNGQAPWSELILDPVGNFYGTTMGGGIESCNNWQAPGCGVVFELTPVPGARWKEKILYKFTGGSDGTCPRAGLTLDADGNLYGAAVGGGNLSCNFGGGCGTVFKITP